MPMDRNIWVFFGLIAAGKSVLAENWAARHGMTYLNSDRIRKELAGISPVTGRQEALDRGIYASGFSRRTYSEMLLRAAEVIKQGGPVVLDASYQSRQERDRVRELARRLGVDVFFVLCNCPEEEIMRRLEIRRDDPAAVSDGRPEIYLAQKGRFEKPEELAETELVEFSTDQDLNILLGQLDEIFEVEKDE